jgi:membrane-associated phospholipid phosphatase
LFILLFFWKGARRWVRAVMVTYVLAMAFILVYGGEHFAFDILVGWLYAITVAVGFALATDPRRTWPPLWCKMAGRAVAPHGK